MTVLLIVLGLLGFMFLVSRAYHTTLSMCYRKCYRHITMIRNSGYNDFAASSPKNKIASDSFLQWVSSQPRSNGIIPVGPIEETKHDDGFQRNKLPVDIADASSRALQYFSRMESVAPPEMIFGFAQSAPKHIQDAVMLTIVNIFGKFPTFALDAILVTTKIKLAELLYQMQLTGYLFKNAEYRMSMTGALRGLPKVPSNSETIRAINSSKAMTVNEILEVRGEAVVNTISSATFSVDAGELTRSLKEEITALRQELLSIKAQREQEFSSNLLTYIQALPEQEHIKLTSDMSSDVLQAIHLLVKTIIDKIGEGVSNPEVPMQQNAGNLAQLCIWHMVMGYRLRELEALDIGISFD